MLIMHANKDQLEAMAPLVCNFFEALGLMVNTKKSTLNPAQLIEFVVNFGQANSGITHMSPSTSTSDRVGCLTTWVGSMMYENQHRRMLSRWSTQEAIHHINYLELLAAFLALKTFASYQLQKGLILLRIDNISAVTYIDQKRGTHSTQLSNLALEIWEWCLQHQLAIQAKHLPGSLNWVEDSESRTMKDQWDWMINPKVFQQICQSLGPLQIDLFALRLTKQLPHYYGWRLDPEAEVMDAFTQNWAQARGFANPPWCLISRCLNQIK